MCKINWTQEQDKYLIYLKESQKIQSWSKIGDLLNQCFIRKERSGKQCRERYVNHLKLLNKSCQWGQIEDEKLFELYEKYGSRWTFISQSMIGRSQNTVKNRFYGLIRKLVRLLNRLSRQNENRKSKPIKYQSIIRVIELTEEDFKDHEELTEQGKKLRKKIFSTILLIQKHIQNGEAAQFVNQIHQFNLKTRCFCPKKRRNNKEKKNLLSLKANTCSSEISNIMKDNAEVKIEEPTETQSEKNCQKKYNSSIWNLLLEQQGEDELAMPQLYLLPAKSAVQSAEELQYQISQLL